jgi:hypothetical protein
MIALGVVAALLLWQVVAQSFAAYLADSAPQMALWLHPRLPAALIGLADQALDAANKARATTEGADQPADQNIDPSGDIAAEPQRQVPGDAAKPVGNLDRAFSAFETVGQNQSVTRPIAPDNAPAVRAWAQTALGGAPLSVHALRILGLLAEADGDDAGALRFMAAAARLSLHDGPTDFWLMQKSIRAKDDKSALYYADVLLRTTPDLAAYVVPVIAHIAEDKGSSPLLNAMLAENPPWRREFFAALPNSITDARTPLGLLMALRQSAAPPSPIEVGDYVKFLIGRKFYDLAYYTWLQFLPPAELRSAGKLFNGSFDVTPSGLPFDWQIQSGAGVTVDIVPRSDRAAGHALLVDFQYGRVDFHSVTELVMLAPGTYEFGGQYKGKLVGPRGLKWRVACFGGAAVSNAPLGESAMIIGMTPTWRAVAFNFTVPAKDCKAQMVSLDLDARMASEQLVSGSVLFGELRISRVASPS